MMHDDLRHLQELDVASDDDQSELIFIDVSTGCDLFGVLFTMILGFCFFLFVGYIGPKKVDVKREFLYLDSTEYTCFQREFNMFRPYSKLVAVDVTTSNNSHMDLSGYITFTAGNSVLFQTNIHGKGDGFVSLYETKNVSFDTMSVFICTNGSEVTRVFDLQMKSRNLAFFVFIEFFRVHFSLYFLVFGSLLWRLPPAPTQLQIMTRYLIILTIVYNDPALMYSYMNDTQFSQCYEIFHYAIELLASAFTVFYVFHLFTDNVLLMTAAMILSVIRHPLIPPVLVFLLLVLAFFRGKKCSPVYAFLVVFFGAAHIYNSLVPSSLDFLIPLLVQNMFTAVMNALHAPVEQFVQLRDEDSTNSLLL